MNRTTLALFLSTALASGCVLSPSWGDEPTRRDPIDFDGMASKAGATVRIQAWNHGLSQFETVSTFTGTSQRYASDPDLFAWSRIGVQLADRYWVPAGASCQSSGMANLRVQEQNDDGTWMELATFDAAGEDCVYDRIGDGSHPVAAGNACKLDDARIVLFAPPQCVLPASADATPPVLTVRLLNAATPSAATRVFERTSGVDTADLTVTGLGRTTRLAASAHVRDRDGAVRSVQLLGDTNVLCRGSDGSTLLVPVSANVSRSQSITTGVPAEIGLDASRVIDVPGLAAARCPAGTTFQEIRGVLFATGTNAAGTSSATPALRFTIR